MNSHVLQAEIRQHVLLREQLMVRFGLDPEDEALRDTLDGLSDLREITERIAASINEDKILLAGIKGHLAAVKERETRIELRIERQEAALLYVLTEAQLGTLALPFATIGTARTPAKVIIEDESKIPSEYMTKPEPPLPQPDKRLILQAINDGKIITGATKSNGGIRISWRSRGIFIPPRKR